jgi:hypothetical protein
MAISGIFRNGSAVPVLVNDGLVAIRDIAETTTYGFPSPDWYGGTVSACWQRAWAATLCGETRAVSQTMVTSSWIYRMNGRIALYFAVEDDKADSPPVLCGSVQPPHAAITDMAA